MLKETLSDRALNRALLARQLLLRRHEMSAEAAIEHLVGMQSQAPIPPYFGLWTRLKGFDPGELVQLMNKRSTVRVAMMRSTVHLVTAPDCLHLRPLLQPGIEREFRAVVKAEELAQLDLDAFLNEAREFLKQAPRTNTELGSFLQEKFPDQSSENLVRYARTFLTLIQVPPRGLWGESGQTRSTTVENWLSKKQPPGSIENLVLRYLAAFGPASTMDAQKWSGLTKLGEIFEHLRPQLKTFRDEQGRELFDLPDAPRPEASVRAPVRFLPEFDNILLSHTKRDRIIRDEYRSKVFTINGIIKSTILVNGTVAGLWKISQNRELASLAIEPFTKLSAANLSALETEGKRLLSFAAPRANEYRVSFLPSATNAKRE